jgi:hypothetical protein
MHPDTTFGKISGAVELRAHIEARKAKNLQTSRKSFMEFLLSRDTNCLLDCFEWNRHGTCGARRWKLGARFRVPGPS